MSAKKVSNWSRKVWLSLLIAASAVSVAGHAEARQYTQTSRSHVALTVGSARLARVLGAGGHLKVDRAGAAISAEARELVADTGLQRLADGLRAQVAAGVTRLNGGVDALHELGAGLKRGLRVGAFLGVAALTAACADKPPAGVGADTKLPPTAAAPAPPNAVTRKEVAPLVERAAKQATDLDLAAIRVGTILRNLDTTRRYLTRANQYPVVFNRLSSELGKARALLSAEARTPATSEAVYARRQRLLAFYKEGGRLAEHGDGLRVLYEAFIFLEGGGGSHPRLASTRPRGTATSWSTPQSASRTPGDYERRRAFCSRRLEDLLSLPRPSL